MRATSSPSVKPASLTASSSTEPVAAGRGGSQVWSIKSGSLPAGMGLSSNGLISGTPTATGDFTFVVQVTDTNRTDTETYTLSVVERLKIAAPGSAAGEIGVPYALAL